MDCSSIRKHNRSPKDNAIMFKECCAKQFYTLLSGKLYTCPFKTNANEHKAIPSNTMDYVDDLEIGGEIIKLNNINVIIVYSALLFLLGTVLDFEDTKFNSGFIFNNPNEVSRCGCGESFSVK